MSAPPAKPADSKEVNDAKVASMNRQPHPNATQRPPQPGWEPISAFYLCFIAHAFAALYSPIHDCDEVYNYWEPTHYLNHGYGMQTWEYSPEYALRSWVYAGIHAILINIGRLLGWGFIKTKQSEFYFLRICFAFVCAVCEAKLYAVLQRTFNYRVAAFFLAITALSPGMFHASVAYLPSSFAMYGAMLGIASFMDWRGGLRTAAGMMWFGISGVLGWPFVMAMCAPFLAEEVFLFYVSGEDLLEIGRRFADGAARTVLALCLQFGFDTFFYRQISVVSWNMVAYNIFSGSNKGPNIYGTEPWHFYIRNLLLNFNLWFPLALLAMPLLLWQHLIRRRMVSKQTILRSVVFTAPFYMWLAIFSIQPHKEERFMYPAYPALAINAAISVHILLANFGSTDPKDFVSKIPGSLKFAFVVYLVLTALYASALRTVGNVTAYSAPLKVYKPLLQPGVAGPSDTVCHAKEWYRFPSSYFLPNGTKAKFVQSEFSGLLPGEFSEAKQGFGFYPGAWMIPPGMNDENIEDPGKYTDIEHCKFLVDSYFPNRTTSALEPNYVEDTATWERLACEPFLDTARTGTLGRLIWIPNWSFIPEKYQRKWGQYCLLRRKR